MIKFFIVLLVSIPSQSLIAQSNQTYDVVVYGATSSGIAAAVELSRTGKSVIVINPDNHIGGLTTGGLGWTDIGNKMVIGGFSREFYQQIKKYYENEGNWKWEKKSDYLEAGQTISDNMILKL